MNRSKQDLLADLDPHRPDTIQALINFHTRAFGPGWQMNDGAGDPPNGGTGTGKDSGDSSSKQGKNDTGNGGGGKNDGDEPLGEPGKKALQAERDARAQLQKEFNDFKQSQADQAKALAQALGIKTEDTKSDDVVTQLQSQLQAMQHDNLVFRIVTDPKHPITDEDDLALIKGAKDEESMRKLAQRLTKPAADPDPRGKKRPPAADPNRNRSTGDDHAKPGDGGRGEAARRFPKKQEQHQ